MNRRTRPRPAFWAALLLAASWPQNGAAQSPLFKGVSLYEDRDFQGRHERFTGNDPYLEDNPIGNDGVSSVKVDPGCRLVLYRNAHFRGKTVLTRDTATLRGTEVGNDQASSIQVTCQTDGSPTRVETEPAAQDGWPSGSTSGSSPPAAPRPVNRVRADRSPAPPKTLGSTTSSDRTTSPSSRSRESQPLTMAWKMLEQGRISSALALFQRVLENARQSGDQRLKASAHDGLSEVKMRMQVMVSALAHAQVALEIHRRVEAPDAEAATRARLATIYRRIGDGHKAISHLERALAIRQAGRDRHGLGVIFEVLAGARIVLGDLEAARQDFLTAATHWHAEGNIVREVGVYRQLARLDASLGRIRDADRHLRKCLEIYDRAGTKLDLDAVLAKMRRKAPPDKHMMKWIQTFMETDFAAGGAGPDSPRKLSSDPEFDRALREAYKEVRAEEVLTDVPGGLELSLEVYSMTDSMLESVMSQMPDTLYQQMLPIAEASPAALCSLFQQSDILSARARLYQRLNRPTKGTELIDQAWAAWTNTSGRVGAVMGQAFGSADQFVSVLGGLPDVSAEEAQKAGAFPPPPLTDARWCGGEDLNHTALWQAETLIATGDLERAQETYQSLSSSDPYTRLEALLGQGRIAELQGDVDTALNHYRGGIEWAELVLDALKQQPIAFADQLSTAYGRVIRLLVEQGDLSAAFSYTERSRANALHRHLAGNPLEIRGVASEDLRTLRTLDLEITRWRRQQAGAETVWTGGSFTDLAEPMERRARKLEQQRAELLQRVAQANPEAASLVARETVDIATVQDQLLPDETTVVVFYLLDEEVLAWVLSRRKVRLKRLPVPRDVLASHVRHLRSEISYEELAQEPAGKLYDLLVRPLEAHLRQPNVLIVPHGILHYLPFSALWNRKTGRYLVESKALAVAPSMTALRTLHTRQTPFTGSALVLGNPDGSLEHAGNEAEDVATMFGVTAHLGGAAQKRRLLDRAGRVDVLHLAAHGVFDPLDPLASHVQLAPAGAEGQLTVSDIFALDLRQTDLVVLSACQSGLGELHEGDDVIGLTRAFLAAGAPSVVTTLWSVDDAATQALMTAFYRHLLQPDTNAAAALQAAQRELLKNADWESPYFWAASTLTGDPRRWATR